MNTFAANLIFILHLLFIAFYSVVPFLDFTRFPELAILHLATGPLLFIHWIFNSQECALTRLEMFFRGETNQNNSFFYNLVAPIYSPTDDATLKQIIWVLAIGLWLITVTKFIKNPCVMTDFIQTVKNGGRRPIQPVQPIAKRVILVRSEAVSDLV
jgi:hypothetical protein